jgi:hypothetical protein
LIISAISSFHRFDPATFRANPLIYSLNEQWFASTNNLDKHQGFIPLYLLKERTMADDKTKRGTADRSRMNVNEEYEIRYWIKELGVSAERLRELVAKHGVMVADIRRALHK